MEGEEASRLRSLSFKMDDLSHQGATALEMRGFLLVAGSRRDGFTESLSRQVAEALVSSHSCQASQAARVTDHQWALQSGNFAAPSLFRGPRTPLDLVAAFGAQSLQNSALLRRSEQARLLLAQANPVMQAYVKKRFTPSMLGDQPISAWSSLPPPAAAASKPAARQPTVVDLTHDEGHQGEGGRAHHAHMLHLSPDPTPYQEQEPQQDAPGKKSYSSFRCPAVIPAPMTAPSAPPPTHHTSYTSGGSSSSSAWAVPQQPGRTGSQQPGQQTTGNGRPHDQPRWPDNKGSIKRPAPDNDGGRGYGGGHRGGDTSVDSNEHHHHGPDSNASLSGRGFQSAKTALVADYAKKGMQPPSSMTNSSQAPRSGQGLRPPKKQAGYRGFVSPMGGKQSAGGGGSGSGEQEESPYPPRLLEMLAEKNLLGPDGEVPEVISKQDVKLVETICNEILDSSHRTHWDDIAGQDHAKQLIQEMVVWPIQNPQLFKGARAPPKGMLLFGPPGTGKTLIGRAVAGNIDATFFSISASSLTSKWIGEGEKMVRVLFALAGCLQPSVIFIDEIDSILSARKSEGEHEASRRLKTEMLIQMEGCDPASGERRVLLIGATNRPEELDEAARRRLPKQLYIPLPCDKARRSMILRQLGPGAGVVAQLSELDLDKVVDRTAGYSGSDMKNLIQEACQGPIREVMHVHREGISRLTDRDLRPINLRDFQMAAKAQKASVTPQEVLRYQDYDTRHGAKYTDPQAVQASQDEEEW